MAPIIILYLYFAVEVTETEPAEVTKAEPETAPAPEAEPEEKADETKEEAAAVEE